MRWMKVNGVEGVSEHTRKVGLSASSNLSRCSDSLKVCCGIYFRHGLVSIPSNNTQPFTTDQNWQHRSGTQNSWTTTIGPGSAGRQAHCTEMFFSYRCFVHSKNLSGDRESLNPFLQVTNRPYHSSQLTLMHFFSDNFDCSEWMLYVVRAHYCLIELIEIT